MPAWFRRRGPAGPAATGHDPADGSQHTQLAILATYAAAPAGVSERGIGGTAGWEALPGAQNPNQQIGMYAGSLLNQYPARVDGPQKHSAVEWLYPGWRTPVKVGAPQSPQTSQQMANIAGAQRYGSMFQGPLGPLTAQGATENVTTQQIRATGVAALEWARKLNPAYNSSGG